MRDRMTPPGVHGPTTTTPAFEAARRAYLRAHCELTAAALQELILRVRTRHPWAACLVLICDDVEDGLYLAEVLDRTGQGLGTDGPLLGDRTCQQVVGNLNGATWRGWPGSTTTRWR